MPLGVGVLLSLRRTLSEVPPVVAEVVVVVAPAAAASSSSTPPLESPAGEEAPSSAPEVEGPLEATVLVPPGFAGPRAPGLVVLGVLPLAGLGGGGSGPGARPGSGAEERGRREKLRKGAQCIPTGCCLGG